MKVKDLDAMPVGDLRLGFSAFLRKVADTGRPLPLLRFKKSYLHVVPSDLWREAEQALREKRARERAERRAERERRRSLAEQGEGVAA